MNTCSKCGRKPEEGEMFVILIDPNSEWWLKLFDSPQYCSECIKEIRTCQSQV